MDEAPKAPQGRLELALRALEARKAAALESVAKRLPKCESEEKEGLPDPEHAEKLQTEVEALPHHERRQVLDAMGMQHVSAAPRPLEPVRWHATSATSASQASTPVPGLPITPDELEAARVSRWEAEQDSLAVFRGFDPDSTPERDALAKKLGSTAAADALLAERARLLARGCLASDVRHDDARVAEERSNAGASGTPRFIAGRRLWKLPDAIGAVAAMPGFGVSADALKARVQRDAEQGKLTLRRYDDGAELKSSWSAVVLEMHLYAEDFNDWLEAARYGETYRLRDDMAQDIKPAPGARVDAETRQANRLQAYRDAGFGPPKAKERWQGVGEVASKLGIRRQTLTDDLKAAWERERENKRAAAALRPT
jgi:hypothetical protein